MRPPMLKVAGIRCRWPGSDGAVARKPRMNGENILGTTTSLLDKGGPVMLVLLALSIVAVAIVLAKLYQFTRCRLRQTEFLGRAVTALGRGDSQAALAVLGTSPNPVARVMEAAIEAARNPQYSVEELDSEISRFGSAEIRHLESYLRGLEVVANLCPLLGLLGTVLGMIEAFAQMEGAGAAIDPTILAGGIWEALLTTAFGLAIAIPSLAAYYLLDSQVEKVRAAMKDAANRVLGMYRRGVPVATA